MKLYKYRDLLDSSNGDQKEKLRRIYQIILENRLWCASPSSLNDKDEFDPVYDCKPTSATESLVRRLLEKQYGEKPRNLGAIMNEAYLKKVAGERFKEINEKSRSEIGLSCLSRDKDEEALWKEYGGDGYGICIEIEFPDNQLGVSLHDVTYVPEKSVHINTVLSAALDGEEDKKDLYHAILTTKTDQWQYEKEVRFISKLPNVPLKFEKERGHSITGVIFGNRVPTELVDQIKAEIDSKLSGHSIKFSYQKMLGDGVSLLV
jgi:hypothetical protein